MISSDVYWETVTYKQKLRKEVNIMTRTYLIADTSKHADFRMLTYASQSMMALPPKDIHR